MRAEIETINPEYAKLLLEKNIGNRTLKTSAKEFAKQMAEGLWKENGECIIIDKNGTIKDGQHRLHACIQADYTWQCPVIYDVEPDVMDTIDTGTNRTLSDVLQFNGFKYHGKISALVKLIKKYEKDMTYLDTSGGSKHLISNNEGLQYAIDNKDNLTNLVKLSNRIADKQNIRILTCSEIAIYLYIIAEGFNIKDIHEEFLKGVCGVIANSDSSFHYAFSKLSYGRENKIKTSPIYKVNLIIRTWKIFRDNDMHIQRLVIKTDAYEALEDVQR
jgi:hypothetical protein